MANPKDKEPLEGEGSYSAAESYDEEVRKFLSEEDPEKLAHKAEEELDKDEPAFRQAEEEGKRRAAEEDPELHKKQS